LVAVLAAALVTACGVDDDAAVEGQDAPAVQSGRSAAESGSLAADVGEPVPEACTFFAHDELEEAIGWELREGEPEEAPPGLFVCDFETPPLLYVTRTFSDPALPQSVGFDSLTINTHPTSAESFREFRGMIGAEGEDVPGIGDGAYFYGRDMLYVRVGSRGFSIRIYVSPSNEDDWARVREVMLSLARRGAERLA
jgi:hypothetical protein